MSDINFSKLTWENLPARTTALSATNLNRIENGINDSVNGVNANAHSIAELNTRIGQIASGTPEPAELVSQMTEHDKIYVYTGSEPNYTAGNWYYWNGSAWQIGGTYGGAVTDTTLSVSGKPADAKAVGDAIGNITIEVDDTLTEQGKAADAKAVGDALLTVQGGQPTPVTLASQMVDPDTTYLYIGDEDGYDYGYIYAYNGSNFIRLDLYGKGTDGYSPQVSVSQTPTGVSITVVDKNGTSTASVSNGTATDEQVGTWLANHPEATTTVQDGAISNSKLASGIYGRLKTADYAALKRLLSAMLYDTDVESAENVASLINGIIGDKDLGDFMLPINSAYNVQPFAIYSDDGETELYSATSPRDAVFWNEVESVQTEYHITLRTTVTRAWPVYIGEYDPTNKQLNNAVLFSDSFTKSITYSADYTVASGKRLGVVCIDGFLGTGGTKGHGGTYESLTIYKKIV